MGSLKKLNSERKKSTKLTDEELSSIQGVIRDINSIKLDIAELEMQKHGMMQAVEVMIKKYQGLQKQLKEKYGDVDVNIQDGSIREKANGKPN